MIVAITVFVFAVSAVLGLYFAFTKLPGTLADRRLRKRITDVSAHMQVDRTPGHTVLKAAAGGPLPAIDRMATRTTRGSAVGRWLEQTGTRTSISGLLLMTCGFFGLFGVVALMLYPHPFYVPLGVGLVGAVLPLGVLKSKRGKRLRKFEEAFPEALDLMSRAVRAGHAFNTGVKMVAEELADPVGPEFKKTFDEQNFGLPLPDALHNMSERLPLLDVQFFVTAVLIQRDTGGNLAEILENLGHVVRERFKILRQVRVHTAHGRFTGWVLMALPAALAIALMFINPEHMNLLFREPLGHKLIAASVIMQTVGYFWIRKVIKIEV